MDLFSLGCVIAEIFLGSQYLFTLPELLSHKRSELNLPSRLSEIKHECIQELVKTMISCQPEERKTIDYYINAWNTRVLPEEMLILYPFMAQIIIEKNANSPWSRIHSVIKFYESSRSELKHCESLLILAEYITGNMRNVNLPSQLVKSIEILTEIGVFLSDDTKLHRILPYLISILQNKQEKSRVKVSCIGAIVKVLDGVVDISPRDTHLFDEYIWPVLSSLIHDESEWVRTELAATLPKIAEVGRLFFEASVHLFKSEMKFDKEIAKFTTKFVRVFKELIVSKPECQVHVELLQKFADLAAFLDMRSVLNNIIPIVFSWLNKGDSYRVLILTQIPKLLEIIHTPEFFSQIFTCIEDGLTLHNELVVFNTLQNALFGLLSPNRWIQEEVTSIIRNLIARMEDYENYTTLRGLLSEFLDLPRNAFALVTEEVLVHLHKPFKRQDFSRGSHPSSIFKKVFDAFRTKDSQRPQIPAYSSDTKYQIFEESRPEITSPLMFSADPPRQMESLNLKGNLQGCFNEHECSVTNICIVENSQSFLSGSSDGTVKLWSLAQLEPFKPIRSQEFFRSEDKPWKIKSIGTCGDQVFIAHEQGIVISSLAKFNTQSVFLANKLLRAVSLGENNILAVDQQGLLCIFDVRQSGTAQRFKLGNNYGLVSCMCKGPSSGTVGLGTLSSTLILYDIRFVCPSMIYSHSSGLPILTMQSYNSSSMLIGSSEIALLDLQSATATVVLAGYSNTLVGVPSFRENFDSDWAVKNCANISHRTRKTFENPNTIRKLISPGVPYVISGGHDCLVRCWDLDAPQKSFIVGQDPAMRPNFTQTGYPDVKIIQENPFQSQPSIYSVNRSIRRKEYSEVPNHRKCSHTDAILDIALITQPKTVLLTASRDGTIKAWN